MQGENELIQKYRIKFILNNTKFKKSAKHTAIFIPPLLFVKYFQTRIVYKIPYTYPHRLPLCKPFTGYAHTHIFWFV